MGRVLAVGWLGLGACLALWTLVDYLLLLSTLRRLAWQPMLEGLQNRESNIRSAIDEAHKAREEAQRLREQFDQKMAESEEKARAILDQGRRDAHRVTD